METLIKIDPERHMYRWYSVGIQSTLVDGIAVIYGWGSLKSAFQQWRTIPVKSQEQAKEIFRKIVNSKLEKGYMRREMTELGVHPMKIEKDGPIQNQDNPFYANSSCFILRLACCVDENFVNRHFFYFGDRLRKPPHEEVSNDINEGQGAPRGY